MHRKLRVCILQTNLPSAKFKSGGEERFTVELAENLSRRHEVVVISKGERPGVTRTGNLTVRRIRCTSIKYFRFLVYVMLLIREILRQRRLDIIEAHISDGSNGIAGVIASKILRKPCVTRVSRIGPLDSLGPVRKLLLMLIFRGSSHVISINSNTMVERIRALSRKSRVSVLPHGIYESDILKPKTLRKSGERRLLFVGRFVWFKNVGMLVQVMGLLSKRLKGVRLVLIGTGPEEVRIRGMVDGLGLADAVEFRGELPNEEVLRQMERSDVFVFPSIDEPRGRVLIEAMSKGLPIVAVNRGGPRDIVLDGRNGFLVEPGETEKMAGKISLLLGDGGLYARMSRNNVLDVRKYLWKNVIRRFESLYLGLLEG
ncbi:MAG: glycosyltransferase family 4 protein [Candidatus Aenigmarchaeota archaeon]|nr:glycosyltransferase family 4 protein [Candidatus Aenigmarchaeota archaeon]